MSISSRQMQTLPWQYSQSIGDFFIYVKDTDEVLLRDGRRFRPPPNFAMTADIVKATWEGPLPHVRDARSTFLGATDYTRTPRMDSRGPESESSITAGLNAMRLRSPESNQARGRDMGSRPVTKMLQRGGATFQVAEDASSRVRTVVQTKPLIAEDGLFRNGNSAHRTLVGSGGDSEALFPSYKKRPASFFTVGRVFLVLWAEPGGEDTLISGVELGMSTGKYGEPVYSKVRRFVVVRSAANYCSALPIVTYGKKGVSKPGVKRSDHAIIYTGKYPPEPLPEEQPPRGHAPMRPLPIRVDPDSVTDKLDPLSRLDFGAVHTVQHNIKVKSFGRVNERSMAALQFQFANVWQEVPEVELADSKPNTASAGSLATDSRMASWMKAVMARGFTEERAREVIMERQQKAVDELLASVSGGSMPIAGESSSRSLKPLRSLGTEKAKASAEEGEDFESIAETYEDENEDNDNDDNVDTEDESEYVGEDEEAGENSDESDSNEEDINDDDKQGHYNASDSSTYRGREQRPARA